MTLNPTKLPTRLTPEARERIIKYAEGRHAEALASLPGWTDLILDALAHSRKPVKRYKDPCSSRSSAQP